MIGLLFSTLIYLIPLVAIAFFIVSLCNFIDAKKQYKNDPSTANEQKKKSTKALLIVSSVITGVLVAVIVAFIVLMYAAIAYM